MTFGGDFGDEKDIYVAPINSLWAALATDASKDGQNQHLKVLYEFYSVMFRCYSKIV